MTIADTLINIIKTNPESCSCDTDVFKVANAKFWISLGPLFFGPWGCSYPSQAFSFVDRCRLYRAFKWWARNADTSAFKAIK